ncbi:hypothetical protein PFBG_02315 [Plasmodium falciparum 7G8]|uniref:Uncharacterized protein n=3 Tax=Plasmodium falciparum TaxID=5833 RepID=A0A024XBF5_PLAFC|nr:hypothetical protein PFNF135_02401 [Plasmodium falciparum NF135/5.C10]ETW62141.1 hypothetical protein PFMC_02242 [Plasmodium falciparum CAMP/Malaysia]EUR72740.1 hypothetical protein PFBG_02315 [Plasmodium falciparum 7G8]
MLDSKKRKKNKKIRVKKWHDKVVRRNMKCITLFIKYLLIVSSGNYGFFILLIIIRVIVDTLHVVCL